MKRFFVFAVALLFVGILSSAVMTANAQAPIAQEKEDYYIVQKGDTLWVLEGEFSGKPAQWNRLLELNPFLRGSGRVWVDNQGRTIVLIRPGEELKGLKELGIIPNLYPIDQLKVMPQAAQTIDTGVPWWVWLLLTWIDGAIFLFAVIALTRLSVTIGN